MKKIAVSIVALLALVLSLTGCGGQGSSGSVVPASSDTASSTPTTNPTTSTSSVLPDDDDTIESSVDEKSSTSALITKDLGGSVTIGGLTVTIPPSALAADTTIKVASVSVTDDGVIKSNSQCYQISTSSTEEGAELSKPATVTITVDTANAASPELEIWDGFEWISEDAAYDAETQKMTFTLNYIGPDLDQYSYCYSNDPKVHGPVIVEVMSTKGAAKSGGEKYIVQSSSSHFKIHFPSEEYRTFAENLGKYLEEGYTYYSDLGFNKPVNYIYSSADEPYIKVEIFSSQSYTATANTSGVIRMPTVRTTDTEMSNRAVSYHELFHLVCLSYSGSLRRWPPNWIDESMTEAISLYGANYVVNGNKESYYDIAGNVSIPGPKGFNYSLDRSASPECYHTFTFWDYIIRQYGGVAKFKEFVGYNRYDRYDLAWLDGKCRSLLQKSLQTVYNEAFEDYFAYGATFNKSLYCNTGFFPTRAADAPYPLPDYTWWAFSTAPEYNLYNTAQTVQVGHCSGSYVIAANTMNSATDSKKGTLYLTVTNDYPDDVKLKAFRFMKDANGAYTLEGSGEVKTGDTEFASFGTTWNMLYLLIENSSFTNDRSVKIRAYAKEN